MHIGSTPVSAETVLHAVVYAYTAIALSLIVGVVVLLFSHDLMGRALVAAASGLVLLGQAIAAVLVVARFDPFYGSTPPSILFNPVLMIFPPATIWCVTGRTVDDRTRPPQ
jgi:hypothetical protein